MNSDVISTNESYEMQSDRIPSQLTALAAIFSLILCRASSIFTESHTTASNMNSKLITVKYETTK